MINLLEHFKTRQFIGVKELSDAAIEILRQVGPSQEKGTVAEYPNERTVRYYLSEGLLPSPSDKRSQASVFEYEHLLTLLVIKKLQADGLPISVIRTLLADKDIDELEELLAEQITVFTDRQSLHEYQRETDLTDAVFKMASSYEYDNRAESRPPPAKNEAKSFLESLLSRKRAPRPEPPELPQTLFSVAIPSAPTAEEWKRYELAPGLELQVEREFQTPADEAERDRIFDLIRTILRI